jgi:hypothetical protein
MPPYIYFWSTAIDSFKRNNDRVLTIYEDTKIDKDSLWKKYEKEIEKEIRQISWDPARDGSEFADIYGEMMGDAANVFWHAVNMQKIQCIVQLCLTWENQLITFINRAVSQCFVIEKPLQYREVMDDIILKNMEESKIPSLSKIRELKHLVNVIKHGDGISAEKLRITRPDYFSYGNGGFGSTNDSLTTWGSVMLDGAALNVKESEIYTYHDSINDFWNSMPKKLFLDKKTPAEYDRNGMKNEF